MSAVEFITELNGANALPIPQEVAARLPKSGKVRVIVLAPDDPDDPDWRRFTYDQFLRDDSDEDAIYESLR